jgi:hypothetical protein
MWRSEIPYGTGIIRSPRRFVRGVRPGGTREVFFFPLDPPGEQGQVDWASFGSIAIGTTRRPLSYCQATATIVKQGRNNSAFFLSRTREGRHAVSTAGAGVATP